MIFIILKKSVIWTVATAALKEVDKQQIEKDKINKQQKTIIELKINKQKLIIFLKD